MYPYKSLEAYINKDLVGSGYTLMKFEGALKKYSKCYNIICHFKLHSLHFCQIIIFLCLFLCIWNFEWFSKQEGSLKLLFFSVAIYSLSTDKRFLDNQCVSSTNDTGFAWYSKCGSKILASSLSSISNMIQVVFSIPLWHPLILILIFYMPMYLSYVSHPYLLWGR